MTFTSGLSGSGTRIGAAVFLAGQRIFDDDIFYVGYRPLSVAELRELETWQADAERRREGTQPPSPSEGLASKAHTEAYDAADHKKAPGWRGVGPLEVAVLEWRRTRSKRRFPKHHLTAPNVSPRTRNLWITQVSATIGVIMAMVAAQMAPI